MQRCEGELLLPVFAAIAASAELTASPQTPGPRNHAPAKASPSLRPQRDID